MKPREAITRQCVECVGKSARIEKCKGHTCDPPCPFYPLRLGKERASVKIIRTFCLECMCGSYDAVSYCPSETCNLYKFRMGRRW